MSEILMRVVVDLLVFLAYCDDSELDPDLALAKLEESAYFLKKLDPAQVSDLASFLERLSASIAVADPERAGQYSSLLEHLGLDVPSPSAGAKPTTTKKRSTARKTKKKKR